MKEVNKVYKQLYLNTNEIFTYHRTMQHRHTNLNVNKLNITYLNVCGISSKLLNPDFETLINNYDILVLVEAKTDEYDIIKLPNEYACYAKHRKKIKKKSGGIIIIYKKNTVNFFEIYSF